jgi:hypothetical protein
MMKTKIIIICVSFFSFLNIRAGYSQAVNSSVYGDVVKAVTGNVPSSNNTVVEDTDSFDFTDPFTPALPQRIVEPIGQNVESGQTYVPNNHSEHVGPVKAELDLSLLKVSGIVWGEGKSKAIINDQVFGIGDKVSLAQGQGQANEIKVVNITREGILLNCDGKEVLMRRDGVVVHKEEIKS